MALNITVIYGSVRSQRQGIKLANFLVKKLKERKHNVVLVDPLEYQFPLLDKMYKEYEPGKAPKTMEKVAEILRGSDAFVIVSGEYNHGMPPALKNLIDHFQIEYFYKPSAIAAYSAGPFGGARVMIHLRSVLGELGMSSIPSYFLVSMVQSAFDEKGNAIDKAYEKRVEPFLNQLEWYANALKEARKKGLPK